MEKYIYGIDIGGTTIKIGLFSLEGDLLDKWEIVTNRADNGIHVLKDIHESIKRHQVDLKDILGYGFGVPGPVVDGLIIKGINIDWENYNLQTEFSKLTNNEMVFVENDANVAALGETWQGAAKGYKNSAMITVGTGVGGGIIVNSKIVDGAHGSGGEIGHIRVIHENGLLCNCGNKGCLETVASATGIKNMFKSMLRLSELTTELKDIQNISVKMIFDAAKKGDPLCLAVVDKITYYLGYTCQILSVITNPDIIIIGGGVSNAGNFFIDKIRKHFREIAFKSVKNTLIVKAKLGNDAGIYGAASLVAK